MSDVLQEMREMMFDDSFKLSLALIEKIHISADLCVIRAEVCTIPDNYTIIAELSSDSVGGGSITLPNKNDLVLVAFTDEDQTAVILKRLYSDEDKLPKQAVSGDTVLQALQGKKSWISSDTRINLSNSDAEPSENMVFGQVFKTFADDLLTIISTKFQNDSVHLHIGNLGIYTGPSNKAADDVTSKADIDALKASPIGDDAILSDLTYTD